MKRILLANKIPSLTFINPVRQFNFLFKPSEWKTAISEAEKLVGYSTSFLSLRCLLSDELSNVAVQMKKLVGTGHPLLKTAQKLFGDGKQSKELRGLLILLLSKAAGPTSLTTPQSTVSGIYQSQRTLAEVTEIIHTVSLVHRSVIDISQCSADDDAEGADDDADGGDGDDGEVRERRNIRGQGFQGSVGDLEFGNKMSILSGDFLLASATTNLASLNNTKVVELIATAIQDVMEGEFLRSTQQPITHLQDNLPTSLNHPHSHQSHASLSIPPTNQPLSIKNWEEFTFLTAGSLLARGCQSALELANHKPELQKVAFDFGKLMAFAYQLKEDLSSLSNPSHDHISPFFAPLILFTHHVLNSLPQGQHSEEARDDALKDLYAKSPKELYQLIGSESSVVSQLGVMCAEYGRQAMEALNNFQPTPAKNLLVNMVNAVVKV